MKTPGLPISPRSPPSYCPRTYALGDLTMVRSLITEETRARLQERDPRWRSKAVLRVVATFFDFLAMVLFIVAVTMTLHWENVWNNGFGGDWPDGMPLAPVCHCYNLSCDPNPVRRLTLPSDSR